MTTLNAREEQVLVLQFLHDLITENNHENAGECWLELLDAIAPAPVRENIKRAILTVYGDTWSDMVEGAIHHQEVRKNAQNQDQTT